MKLPSPVLLISVFIMELLISISVAYAATSITKDTITWNFSSDYTVGQFVNGDYWVLDSGSGVNIIGISPGYVSTPRAMNGSMLNPNTADQGYDSFDNYDPTKNVGIGISPSTPLILNADVSLVSTISNANPGPQENGDHLSYVNSVAVLTCLSSAPPAGSFRPGLSSSIKTIHNISSINYSKLASLYHPSKPDITIYANYLKMAWLTHGDAVSTRYTHPSASGLSNYYFTGIFSTAAKLLHLDYSNSEKQELLVNYIQLGIDIYSFIESGGSGWVPDGGQSNGRKWPILFAGIMLDYAPMKNIGQRSGDYLYANGHGPGNPPSDYIHFGEDGQTFYVAQSDVDITNGGSWNPDRRNHTAAPYTSAMIGMPEWGIRYSVSPEQSDASWLADYRTIYSGAFAWDGFALSALIMGAKQLWNHNAFFDYMDRYIAIKKGKKDPFGFTVPDEQAGEMSNTWLWDTYRDTFRGTKYKNVKSITQETP